MPWNTLQEDDAIQFVAEKVVGDSMYDCGIEERALLVQKLLKFFSHHTDNAESRRKIMRKYDESCAFMYDTNSTISEMTKFLENWQGELILKHHYEDVFNGGQLDYTEEIEFKNTNDDERHALNVLLNVVTNGFDSYDMGDIYNRLLSLKKWTMEFYGNMNHVIKGELDISIPIEDYQSYDITPTHDCIANTMSLVLSTHRIEWQTDVYDEDIDDYRMCLSYVLKLKKISK
jgi:hypothetical protein